MNKKLISEFIVLFYFKHNYQRMVKIVFCDTKEGFSEEVSRIFQQKSYENYSIDTYTGDIRDMIGDNTAYISPANSLLYFNGGVDYIYSKMFPSLQTDAQELVKKYNYKLSDNEAQSSNEVNYYLPVGSAMIVPVEHINEKIEINYLIASPTMFMPSDIRNTSNVYYAFYAVIAVIDKYNRSVDDEIKIRTVICPGLGTGCGGISFYTCVLQIKEALDDYVNGKKNNDLHKEDNIAYIYECEQ